MKKIIYSALIFCGLAFSGCEDFLTVQSPDKLDSSTFWRDAADARAALATVYAQLEYIGSGWDVAEVKFPVEAYREDLVELGVDASNYSDWVDLFKFTTTSGNSQLTYYWRAPYYGICYANQVIEKTPTIPAGRIEEGERGATITEAHFLRGFYHMKLLMNWERIIIRDKYITSQNELSKELAPRDVAWDFIIQDLKIGTGLIDKRPALELGRATKGAAYAYLGWAYLTRAYEEPSRKQEFLTAAIDAFDKVTGYELDSDFIGMFNTSNKNGKESIFEMQFLDHPTTWQTSTISKWLQSSELRGYDEIIPHANLLKEYKKEGKLAQFEDGTPAYDLRTYATLFFQDEYFNDPVAKRVYGKTFDRTFKNNPATRVVFRKYLPADGLKLYDDWQATNIVMMRYANVLLLKAEAFNELGQTDKAIPLINEIRKVHGGMPPMAGSDYAAVKAQIEHERILEFPLENSRFFDLRRWNKTKEAIEAVGRTFIPASHNFYPIPQLEVNGNESLN
ncbi:MAG: RagB/SusD family nutrient uptake outer membrane protein [Bacteroidales bacterium]